MGHEARFDLPHPGHQRSRGPDAAHVVGKDGAMKAFPWGATKRPAGSTTPTEPTERKTFCGICEASCGLIATVDDAEVVQLRPDPAHPSSRGFACSKGVQFTSVLNDPDRVLSPMRRGPDGSFAQATWREAIDDIGRRLKAIQRAHGNESIGLAPVSASSATSRLERRSRSMTFESGTTRY